jgi:hypothetical protein
MPPLQGIQVDGARSTARQLNLVKVSELLTYFAGLGMVIKLHQLHTNRDKGVRWTTSIQELMYATTLLRESSLSVEGVA